MADKAAAALKKASAGLTYESETDAPFDAFAWKDAEGTPAKDKVLQLGKHAEDEPVEEESLEDFFGELTREQDWHGKAEKAAVRKYRNLLKVIREQLTGAKVFKVGGGPRKAIYIVGRAKGGGWAGLKTTAVET